MKRNIACFLAFCSLLFVVVFSFNIAFAEEEFVVPDHIKETISQYKKIIDENALNIHFNGICWAPNLLVSKSNSDLGNYELTFSIMSPEDAFIMYPLSVYGQAKRSLVISFFSSISDEFRDKFIALTIVVIEPSISFSQAELVTRKLLSSFTGKGHSDALMVGDCFLTMYSYLEELSSLSIVYKNEINVVTDKSQYKQLSFEEIRSKHHPDEKIYVTGIVEQQCIKYADTPDQVEYVIFSSGGHRYTSFFFYPHLPVQFETGQEYTFYGSVNRAQEDGFASMVIDFYEKK